MIIQTGSCSSAGKRPGTQSGLGAWYRNNNTKNRI